MGDHGGVASALQTAPSWPFAPVLSRLGLAVAIVVFVGLEREHGGKAGARTFSLSRRMARDSGSPRGSTPWS